MKFTKMHGIGNDYVYVNGFEESIKDPAAVARVVSDRHFGIGSDGLILINPSDVADCEMEMYNLDGSKGAMCGNGIRCVAKYVYDHGIVDKTRIKVATGSGIKTLNLTVKDGKVSEVEVNMGAPAFAPSAIPLREEMIGKEVQLREDTPYPGAVADASIMVSGEEWRITAVSMGNPHAVVFVPSTDSLDLPRLGPCFENHSFFPDRVNTEFVEKVDGHTVKMRVWERGSGETLACGTGACAAAVASILNGVCEDGSPVTVKLLGGDLSVFWDREKNEVFMTGPATEVFHGEMDV